MDYPEALRCWRAEPRNLLAYTALIQAVRRGLGELPSEIDPALQIPIFVEKAKHTYQLMDAAGYEHVVVGRFFPIKPPYDDYQSLSQLITTMIKPEDPELDYDWDDKIVLAYGCEAVTDVTQVETFGLNFATPDLEHVSERMREPFRELRKLTEKTLSFFPNIKAFEVKAKYPDDGQVYWAETWILYFPLFNTSAIIVVQYFW